MFGLQGNLMTVLRGTLVISHISPSSYTRLKPCPGTFGSICSTRESAPATVGLIPGTVRQVGAFWLLQRTRGFSVS